MEVVQITLAGADNRLRRNILDHFDQKIQSENVEYTGSSYAYTFMENTNTEYKISITNISNSLPFEEMRSFFVTDSQGLIICFDHNDVNTLDAAVEWSRLVANNSSYAPVPVVLLGIRDNDKVVDQEIVEEYCDVIAEESLGEVPYFEYQVDPSSKEVLNKSLSYLLSLL